MGARSSPNPTPFLPKKLGILAPRPDSWNVVSVGGHGPTARNSRKPGGRQGDGWHDIKYQGGVSDWNSGGRECLCAGGVSGPVALSRPGRPPACPPGSQACPPGSPPSSHPGPVRREGTSSCPPTSGQHGVGGDRAVCPQTGCRPSLSLSTSPEPVAGCC